VKGKVKETPGKVTNNPDLQAEGKAGKNTGKIEKKVRQIEKVFEKIRRLCPGALFVRSRQRRTQRPGGRSAWNSEFCIGAGLHTCQAHKPTTSSQEPAPHSRVKGQNLSPANGTSVGRKRMCDQVANMSAVAEQGQVRVPEMASPSLISSCDKLLSRIAILLFVLVAGVLTVFGYYASPICITVLLAGFLVAILFDLW
jgi:uncharacterized protein YjbJ (UPF0337 family)